MPRDISLLSETWLGGKKKKKKKKKGEDMARNSVL